MKLSRSLHTGQGWWWLFLEGLGFHPHLHQALNEKYFKNEGRQWSLAKAYSLLSEFTWASIFKKVDLGQATTFGTCKSKVKILTTPGLIPGGAHDFGCIWFLLLQCNRCLKFCCLAQREVNHTCGGWAVYSWGCGLLVLPKRRHFWSNRYLLGSIWVSRLCLAL